ncbi:hypothetical protein M378DRAFT_18304 [Amanita muscaria Koide BX008]|uniref:Uncharacterized protein n=1 Tax=Amanita muscaria (strain Koide BX008) TaxID=946122 RepID=A0A0C2W1R2_AMAMK|nr:hypothetical protein M378DRAFT_18304 [Amanita muscaria Koide BX008]
MTLGWWIKAIEPQDPAMSVHARLWQAILDVEWVLIQLVCVLKQQTTLEPGSKRPPPSGINKPLLKRSRLGN